MAVSNKSRNIIRDIFLALIIGVLAYAFFTGQLTLGGSDNGGQGGTNNPAAVDPDNGSGSGSDSQQQEQSDPDGQGSATDNKSSVRSATDRGVTVYEDGQYTSKDEVALYIHAFGHLPSNYITKADAEDLGWTSEGGKEPYKWGYTIGGDHFGNYEGLLPKAKGRTWRECDILEDGQKSRGTKRIVFSNDGLIYYCDDHYESFTQLY